MSVLKKIGLAIASCALLWSADAAKAVRWNVDEIIGPTDWTYKYRQDAMSDTPVASAHRRGVPDRTDGLFLMMVACVGGQYGATFASAGVLGGAIVGMDVTYRVDGRPAVSENWITSTSGSTVNPRDSKTFLANLRGGSRLLVRTVGWNGDRSDATFSIVDLEEALSIVGQKAGCR